jgi:hypothetical protein
MRPFAATSIPFQDPAVFQDGLFTLGNHFVVAARQLDQLVNDVSVRKSEGIGPSP